ncbi:hypothetical protein PanWU01x14_166190 [Parasponia andersonii]|uniref:Uncharacterized protein n=1 Tax=Parasponia andersonii TaxID=3476 RepID=A0A2P5CBK1_PARAD|nr:hypothetical protein PanWU01x14_166190 [Parasponia andersonii]
MAAGAGSNPRILSNSRGSKLDEDDHKLWFQLNKRDHQERYHHPQQQQSFFSDAFFGFLDGDDQGSPESYGCSDYGQSQAEGGELYDDQDDEEEKDDSIINDKKFWENQQQLLLSTLRRTSSLETRIRSITKEAIKEMQISGREYCGCGRGRPVMANNCKSCLIRDVSSRIRNDGYNSAVCKSKWRSSLDHIPSGDHMFVDVVESSSSKRGEVRVIIEVNLRAEFEMARASEEYNGLVQRLPEVFVGKVERLHSVIKIMCSAAKKCMKEKKMHLAPWRKYQYMQAKWLAACERDTSSSGLLSVGGESGGRHNSPKPRVGVRASMLTVDLLEMMPNMRCKAVAVV